MSNDGDREELALWVGATCDFRPGFHCVFSVLCVGYLAQRRNA